MAKISKRVSFKYNALGLRVQKKEEFLTTPAQDPVVTNYTLHGKNVVHMTRRRDELHFFYDAQNRPAVVVYNGTAYAYVKNLQGDIIAILDSAGTVVVSYTYDAWGAPTCTTGTMAATLGVLNPFRYRGYVYDEETGLFYLRSRYYSTIWHRFTNADSLYVTNLFSYCSNCPTMNTDSNGYLSACFLDDDSANGDSSYSISKDLFHNYTTIESSYSSEFQRPVIKVHIEYERWLATHKRYQWNELVTCELTSAICNAIQEEYGIAFVDHGQMEAEIYGHVLYDTFTRKDGKIDFSVNTSTDIIDIDVHMNGLVIDERPLYQTIFTGINSLKKATLSTLFIMSVIY